ncbi:basic helix-loop-helix zip transcription factor [Holotrichia oblita]|uniref:Basic helix-loop-helix zip transcription factor n=1 Tax=Holotrichia oblita TaxID=644536 RepID=A0ACB9TEU7_HOLOL|nr:basic helix-loop-helix zip transcription factor [Holotrichia oblita]
MGCFQTEVNFTKMESFPRNTLKMEGQDSAKQCNLEVLAHAIYKEAKYIDMSICFTIGCGYSQQARGYSNGGKYWKRKLEAVTAEYKKWRMFYKNQSFGYIRDANDLVSVFSVLEMNFASLEMELMKCELSNSEADGMLIDEDYMGLMSDTLFSTITNHPFAFPDTREIGNL